MSNVFMDSPNLRHRNAITGDSTRSMPNSHKSIFFSGNRSFFTIGR
ncbi:MAG: hypothetical protein L6V87_09465 [Ruminococcus sp.]|nr:MAG: hypothetical protein L6V87_09465 [Ruminococcus sp.]